jgi:predicted DNA-binding helix-hairpin-helix protein
LYQADWLMRVYGFTVNEIVDDANPQLDTAVDPKLGWALRNLHLFPIDINEAPAELIQRVPGIGMGSARKIVQAREFGRLGWEELKRIGIAMNRARFFIVCRERSNANDLELPEAAIRNRILSTAKSKFINHYTTQGVLF